MDNEPEIRATTARDVPHLKALYERAFPDENLAPLVERLLAEVPDILSLVAVNGDQLLGHVLFTPCRVGEGERKVALLAPLAIAPSHQRQGVGSALVREGFNRLCRSGLRQVLVLGDPSYYGRFGFRTETSIVPPYMLPREWSDAWQSAKLDERTEALAGKLRPPAAWLSPALWAP